MHASTELIACAPIVLSSDSELEGDGEAAVVVVAGLPLEVVFPGGYR